MARGRPSQQQLAHLDATVGRQRALAEAAHWRCAPDVPPPPGLAPCPRCGGAAVRETDLVTNGAYWDYACLACGERWAPRPPS